MTHQTLSSVNNCVNILPSNFDLSWKPKKLYCWRGQAACSIPCRRFTIEKCCFQNVKSQEFIPRKKGAIKTPWTTVIFQNQNHPWHLGRHFTPPRQILVRRTWLGAMRDGINSKMAGKIPRRSFSTWPTTSLLFSLSFYFPFEWNNEIFKSHYSLK